MNIFEVFETRVRQKLAILTEAGHLPAGLDFSRVVVEPPRDPSHGDLATNAAMVYAKEAKASFPNPRQLATEIADALAQDGDVEQVDVAGPGFINIRLKPDVFASVIRVSLTDKNFGRGKIVPGKVNVEYVSANPTGPLHVGHGRQAALGDAICNLLASQGHQVYREFYYNDAGVQIQTLATSVQ